MHILFTGLLKLWYNQVIKSQISARNKEKAAKLLHILIKSAQPTLVRLYLKPIMSILMPKVSFCATSQIYVRGLKKDFKEVLVEII